MRYEVTVPLVEPVQLRLTDPSGCAIAVRFVGAFGRIRFVPARTSRERRVVPPKWTFVCSQSLVFGRDHRIPSCFEPTVYDGVAPESAYSAGVAVLAGTSWLMVPIV